MSVAFRTIFCRSWHRSANHNIKSLLELLVLPAMETSLATYLIRLLLQTLMINWFTDQCKIVRITFILRYYSYTMF